MKKPKSKTKYVLALIFVFATTAFFGPKFYDPPQTLAVNDIAPSVQIGKATVFVEVSSTGEQVQRGLSGRSGLPAHRGMLFAFSKPAIYRFWMPNMRFPLDMIWINNGAVVGISRNATADFNPAKPVFYTPPSPAQYVVEVNAGFADANSIKIGDRAVFNNIEYGNP